MPAVQPYLMPVSMPAASNVTGPAMLPVMLSNASASSANGFASEFEAASNRVGNSSGAVRAATPSARLRRAREVRDDGCVTRYPTRGGFTRASRSSPQVITSQAHTQFLQTNAVDVAFGELLEMLRPKNDCPNRDYRDNAELRDELWKRMYCLKIHGYASVNGMARVHKIPSLLVDDPAYFPGTAGAIYYDIGFQALRNEGMSPSPRSRMAAQIVEVNGRIVVHNLLNRETDSRDPYHGFTPYFKLLQFHAHANGMQDAADMLDRITRDDSFGHPVTGPSNAADFLADHAAQLNAHLRACERAAEPSFWKRFVDFFLS